ncbi:MAG: 30S ribosome-binding factor RbfA [Pseudomonadota bacterium]
MSEFSRTQRVADQMQREIALLLQREIKDPRLKLTTVAGVDVTKDLSLAKVYVTFLDADEKDEISQRIKLLSNAAGFFRSQLSKAMRLRVVPEIRFYYDESVKRGSEMDSLIQKALAKDKKSEEPDS